MRPKIPGPEGHAKAAALVTLAVATGDAIRATVDVVEDRPGQSSSGEASEVRSRVSEEESNAISVLIELQADCLAGIWGRGVKEQFGAIEAGDFEEAINAARQIGDDTLQRNAGQVPMPDSFTHGSSVQRAKWFQIGLKSGQVRDCDTFAAGSP